MVTDAIQNFTSALMGRLSLPNNRKGEVLGQVGGQLTTFPLVKEVGFVESGAELDAQRGTTESFNTVFNQWLRISRQAGNATGDDWSNEAIPSELDEWTYSDANNSITCTVNSASLVGFISPSYYEDYVLEAQLSSGNADDDYIGFCIAFAEDDLGRTHTLTVTRQLNGPAPMSIIKDRNVNDYVIKHVFDGLTWQDGTVATGSLGGTSDQGWNLIPNGIRLKVTREGDIVTIETSQVDSSVIHDPATTVIDLSADPELEVFRGPQRWGYVCHSQVGSTWEVFQRPGEYAPVMDLRDGSLWTYDSGAWSQQAYGISQAVTDGLVLEEWLHANPDTGKFFYKEPGGSLVRV